MSNHHAEILCSIPTMATKMTAEAQVITHWAFWLIMECYVQLSKCFLLNHLHWDYIIMSVALVGWLVCQTISPLIGQSLNFRFNYSSIILETTLTGVNYLNYPFSRSSSRSFWSRSNWLGLIINQENSVTPFTILLQEVNLVFPVLMHVISISFAIIYVANK